MESVALNYIIALFLVYLVAGLLPIVGMAFTQVVSRFDCLAWGSFLIYYAAFMLVPLTEVNGLVAIYLEKGCEFDVIKQTCGIVYTQPQLAELIKFKQYNLLFTFLFTFAIGGSGVNIFSQGVAGRGSFINDETLKEFLKWLKRIKDGQKKIMVLLFINLAITLVSLFVLGWVVKHVS